MISTSSHKNWHSNKYNTYAISGNCGQDANYQGIKYILRSDFNVKKRRYK